MDQVLDTPLTRLAGVRHPVVQTGMGWVAGPRLVSAVANAGGLGVLASATMTLEQLTEAIHEVKDRTEAPFGVNLRADAGDAGDRIDLLIKEQVKVASFALAPKQELIAKLKDAGVVVIPSVGARRHAEKVAAWGADAVLVQGGEGGGHTGAVATTLLLPQVVDAVDIPVIAAGGFFDGRGLAAALAYGAGGVAMGTRFLLTADSSVPEDVKKVYLGTKETVVTRQVDGMPHRVLRSELVDELERAGRLSGLVRALRNGARFKKISGMSWREMIADGKAMKHGKDLSWSQVLMAANTPMLLKAAMVDGRPDLGVMASGQVVALIDALPTCEDLIDGIVTTAAARIKAGQSFLA
ncbi:nitronate monooxygenase [Actinomadura barringtoniae]|uniref:Nitronate monooxygenase n=1 Tax=Actinomadura barringtoniae TaxID=1427535 RepID=A0A939PBK2_9ACTN|nr:nitronate monooxygenase [Actinomadura barringtoniae]MBO2449413.1 nitronate monooxygenase [Actinomadura barringtoniae]